MTDGKAIYAAELFRETKTTHKPRSSRTWIEPARKLSVFAECDVLVIGGGPAGTTSAIAAARLGADTILLEHHNHLGGLSTGGLVFWIDRMTDWDGQLVIRGLAEEIFDRLPKEYVQGPTQTEWGSRNPELVQHWAGRLSAFHGVVTWSPMVCPEKLKHVYAELIKGSGARLVLHSWVSSPIVEANCIKGVVFESKEGRQAIFAKVVIDATGDGDLFHRAGARSISDVDKESYHHTINTSWSWSGVDMKTWYRFRNEDEQGFSRFMASGRQRIGTFDKPIAGWRDDVALFMGPRLVGYDALNVDDLTAVDVRSQELMWQHLAIYRDQAPGFQAAFPIATASQTGVRHSRRLAGISAVERKDWSSGEVMPDEIGVSPSLSPKFKNISVPFGAMVPEMIDGVIAPGRHVSCDATSHSFMREIPQCWLTGHAAGVAGAICAASGVMPRYVNIDEVQRELLRQGTNLRTRVDNGRMSQEAEIKQSR